jgi:hypothetical protein
MHPTRIIVRDNLVAALGGRREIMQEPRLVALRIGDEVGY